MKVEYFIPEDKILDGHISVRFIKLQTKNFNFTYILQVFFTIIKNKYINCCNKYIKKVIKIPRPYIQFF